MTPHLDRYARQRGIISHAVHDQHVMAVGTGTSSGSIALLVRSGVKRLTLIDPQTVAPENLCRSAFTAADIGRPKVEALRDYIHVIDASVQVTALQEDFCQLREARLDELFAGVSLTLAGTDQFRAQAHAAQASLRRNVPAVFVGAHERALGGRIIWTIPGETPCYRCVASTRYEAAARGERTDLDGGSASYIDMTFLDSVSLKTALAILERGQDSDFGRLYEAMRGRTEVIVRMHPDYRFDGGVDIFDVILADLPEHPRPYRQELKDLAYLCCDTLWLHTSTDPDCPLCGGGGDATT